jgi:ADP-ribose pyrophosphatase
VGAGRKRRPAAVIRPIIFDSAGGDSGLLDLRQRTFQVRGRTVTHHYVHFGEVVVILARDEEGRVLAVRQYRAALDREILELPAGRVEAGEGPEAAARRELEEETGYRAERLERLLWFWPTPGYSDEVIHVFTASGLRRTAPRPDPGEDIRLVPLTPAECERAVRAGEIRDGKSLVALLALRANLHVPD